jgi:predicted metal-binding membrane protein
MMAVRSIDATLEALVRRDRQVVIAALTIVIALSWGYLLVGAGMPMMTPVSWTLGYAVLMFFMWWIMMLAMMLPSAAPMVLLFASGLILTFAAGKAALEIFMNLTGATSIQSLEI